MGLLVSKFLRYLRIFYLYARMSYLRALEYRLNFVFNYLATVMHNIGYIVFIGAVLSQVPTVVGWTFDNMLTLFAVNQFVVYLTWAIFYESIVLFPSLIKTGDLDQLLKLPINSRFTVSVFHHNADLPLPLLTTLGVMIYSLRNAPVEFHNVLLFILLLIAGLIILYNTFFAIISICFWTVEGEDLPAMVSEFTSYARYPSNVFPQLVKLFFVFIIPILLVIYVPVAGLLNILTWDFVAATILMLVVTSVVSQKIWKLGLRHYSSASS